MESKDKKASKLSYSEWFSFYMAILHNNIPLAHAYAKRAYSSQLEEVENDDIDIELENYKDIDNNNLYLYRPHIKDIDDKLHMKNKKLKYGEVSFELTAGNYTVGMDIPEGRYKIMAMKNFGNIYNKYYTFDENLDVDDEENKKFYARLIIGDILIIRGALVVKLSSKKANLLQNLIRRPLGTKIILKTGDYICGKDFKSGVYDIRRVKNDGTVCYEDIDESFSDEDYDLKEMKNCLFKNNDYLGVSDGLVVELIPSQNNYIK